VLFTLGSKKRSPRKTRQGGAWREKTSISGVKQKQEQRDASWWRRQKQKALLARRLMTGLKGEKKEKKKARILILGAAI